MKIHHQTGLRWSPLLALLLVAACADAPGDAPLPMLEPEALSQLEAHAADQASALRAEARRTLVVDFVDGTTKSQFDGWEAAWGVDLEFNSESGLVTGITLARDVADPEAVLAAIRAHPAVESAELMETYAASFTPNDPEWDRQWNLKLIDMPKAWETTRGKGVIVAVIDTGIAYEDHEDFVRVPDLEGVRFVPGYDFVNDDAHANDDHGHGTHVAGTIAQATHNRRGVAGIAHEATLMPVKVLNHFGHGNSADIAEAIRWAADHGAKVINLSLGGGLPTRVMQDAVKHANAKGTTVIAAAGNAGRGKVEFPAAYEGVIAVGAVGVDGHRAPYSSYGPELDLVAPGGNKSLGGDAGGILQNTIDPRDVSRSVYASYQGTSMATPHVAGVAALLYAAGAKDPATVERALRMGASQVPAGTSHSEEYGYGMLNARASLEALAKDQGQVEWTPFVWASGLLAMVLLTLRGRERPGYLNVLFGARFLIPMLLSTVGLFFLSWFDAGAAVQAAGLPLPDFERIIFGRRTASPLAYSALFPVLLSFIAIAKKGFRPVVAGFSLGFAGLLAYAAWSGTPALAWMPFHFLAVPWLAVNALICLGIARAMLRREVA